MRSVNEEKCCRLISKVIYVKKIEYKPSLVLNYFLKYSLRKKKYDGRLYTPVPIYTTTKVYNIKRRCARLLYVGLFVKF